RLQRFGRFRLGQAWTRRIEAYARYPACVPPQEFLRNHPAHGVADQMNALTRKRVEQRLERLGKSRECHLRQWLGAAISRHVPRNNTETRRKGVELRLP